MTATATWAENHVQQGVLRCDVADGVVSILGSNNKMICEFERNDGTVEQYTGRVLKIGVDIGTAKDSKIVWAVYAPSGDYTWGPWLGTIQVCQLKPPL